MLYMNKKTILYSILLFILCSILSCGCGGGQESNAAESGGGSKNGKNTADKDSGPLRDNTPKVLSPAADGIVSYGSDLVTIDASHTDQGYAMVQYRGTNPKVKLQIAAPGDITYTYLLSQSGEFETFPLAAGNGVYSFTVYENVEGDMYSVAYTADFDAAISDEFLPFLYPNQYVSFTSDSQAVAKAKDLASEAHSDLDVVREIYHYVIKNVTYDTDKAKNVAYGYLPDVDDTLKTGKGICFDYAALMSSMLRSQGIPTKLEVGYAGEAYHAWISTYINGTGWIDDIIEFDGTSWSLMDPTFAASTNSKGLKEYIGDGSNYVLKYSY